ncbi:hypothetical protein NC651_019139 [Populus alba x Populus x berolinensis]|nr:hypothetical protein NC651_019139 [Populus alba x Populus x berolinensis]
MLFFLTLFMFHTLGQRAFHSNLMIAGTHFWKRICQRERRNTTLQGMKIWSTIAITSAYIVALLKDSLGIAIDDPSDDSPTPTVSNRLCHINYVYSMVYIEVEEAPVEDSLRSREWTVEAYKITIKHRLVSYTSLFHLQQAPTLKAYQLI